MDITAPQMQMSKLMNVNAFTVNLHTQVAVLEGVVVLHGERKRTEVCPSTTDFILPAEVFSGLTLYQMWMWDETKKKLSGKLHSLTQKKIYVFFCDDTESSLHMHSRNPSPFISQDGCQIELLNSPQNRKRRKLLMTGKIIHINTEQAHTSFCVNLHRFLCGPS